MSKAELSQWADEGLQALQAAVDEAIDRKRRLGQYWVIWDGEKVVEVHPDDSVKSAAE
ncbi:MAG: hypothetical protein JF615_00075 [Asticcacaulis sp.]|nr:hypothetical protein [Asticcacaulis sp.]